MTEWPATEDIEKTNSISVLLGEVGQMFNIMVFGQMSITEAFISIPIDQKPYTHTVTPECCNIVLYNL